MGKRILSVFVDESGVLHQSDTSSRFYLLTMVFHDQTHGIDALSAELDACVRRLGIERMCFHAGPIIRQTDEFAILSWELRAKIFSLMMGFVRKADFTYHTFVVDKRFVNSSEQIVNEIDRQFAEFWNEHPKLHAFDGIKIYYDCGQAPITNLLHQIAMTPSEYKFFGGPRNFKKAILRRIKTKES